MQDFDDTALLNEYTERGSEEAFAALVARHINKVYSVALRYTGNPDSAEEITQAVFVLLGKKCRNLSRGVILSGWLYQTARLVSQTYVRSEFRRSRREKEAHLQTDLNQNEPEAWTQIAPLLDAAMGDLNEKDRSAILLRFFDGRSMQEVGAALGATEDAAKMRVSRAVEKLQKFFLKRGINSTTAVITGAIATNSVQTAPMALLKTTTATALAQGATGAGSTPALIKGALKVMAWTKAKTTIAVGVGILLAAGTTTVAIKEIQMHRIEAWRQRYDPSIMGRIPQQVKILSAIFWRSGGSWGDNDYGKIGLGVRMMDLLQSAYDCTKGRIIVAAPIPGGDYDFMANLPHGAGPALQREITKQFRLVGRRELIETNVFLLVLRNPNAPELKPAGSAGPGTSNRNPSAGSYWGVNEPISDLAGFLEDCLKTPVLDQTGLTNRFDIEFAGGSQPETFKQVVLKEVGLELVPSRRPIEFLVIEKAPLTQ